MGHWGGWEVLWRRASAPTRRCVSYSRGGAEVEPLEVNTQRRGRPNQISTVRFPSPVALTWLPKSLFAQFMRTANRYFLVVSILVCMPFSPTAWSSTALPFAAVLLWTALKDLYEDLRRRRDDQAENFRACWRFDPAARKFLRTRWEQVLCGDVLLTLQDEVFPADLLIIGAGNGRAFISTANLDGETNLKERRPPDPCLASIVPTAPAEPPSGPGSNPHTAWASSKEVAKGGGDASGKQGGGGVPDTIHEAIRAVAEVVASSVFDGTLKADLDQPKVGFDDMGGRVSLQDAVGARQEGNLYAEHFAPRGCVLRNTPWLVSVAAYCGNETKSRLNVAEVAAKVSNLQFYLNSCVRGLICTLAVFCFYAAIMGQALGTDRGFGKFIIRFLIYWIILYQIVPISLYVCFEILKLLLGMQINIDPQMVDPATGLQARARTADLVEELGQVQHIFSDKTGTITSNEMRFARCCIEGQDLGDFRPCAPPASEAAAENHKVDHHHSNKADLNKVVPEVEVEVKIAVPEGVVTAKQLMEDPSSKVGEEVRRFFLCLATCHNAQVELGGDGEPKYSGSSPDEVAFLEGTQSVGIVLKGQRLTPRDGMAAVELTVDTPGKEQVATVLCQVPFNSDRKRMSVICEMDGNLMCITKGADSVMGPLCGSLSETSLRQIDLYAKMGLRTLVVGWKPIDRAFLTGWLARMETAKGADPEARVVLMEQAARELEHSLRLSGISAIEDRLQDGVPDAMSVLKEMGIRVWVLTGDKTETAVEIARSCSLLTDHMVLVQVINATSEQQAEQLLLAGKRQIEEGPPDASYALVLDGMTMGYAVPTEEGQQLLFEVGKASKVCVCCRLAPQQKRKLVEIVRRLDKAVITLSIGDGANDVPMIQGAHVGIGVRGKEGSQAVQASDVAISQFRFLVPLLQCHGRRAYRRVAVFLCYYVYKHVTLAVGDMCWAHENKFTGTIAYPEWVSSAYAALFTSLPVILILAFDSDVPDAVALAHPEMYAEGPQKIHFNGRIFAVWMLSGIYHGTVAFLVPNLVMHAGGPGSSGNWNKEWWIGSITGFSLVLVFVDVRLWLACLNRISYWTLGVLFTSPLAYIITLMICGHTYLGEQMQPQIQGVPAAAVSNKKAMATLFITPLILLIDTSVVLLASRVWPTPLDKVRRLDEVRRAQGASKHSRVSPPL